MKQFSEDLIEVQHENGDDCDPDTGEAYDFSELIIDIEVVSPKIVTQNKCITKIFWKE